MLRHITRASLQTSKALSSTISPVSSVLSTNYQTPTNQQRWKHSKRQIKNMQFKQSAALRQKMLYKNSGLIDDILYKDIPTRRYEAVYEPPNGILSNGSVLHFVCMN